MSTTAETPPKIWRSRVFTEELAWVTFGQLVAAAGGVAGVRWLTRSMDPSLYGELGLALTGLTLVQQSVGGPIAQAVMRYFSAAREEEYLPEYFRSVFRMLRFATWIIVCLAFIALTGLWLGGQNRWLLTVLLTFSIALLTGYNLAFEAIQNAGRNRGIVAWHQGLIQWLRPLSALLLFSWAGVSIETALSGFLIATLLVVCSQWIMIRKNIAQLPAGDRVSLSSERGASIERRMRDYAWPFASWGLLCWSQIASDRWFLALFRDPAAVASYTVCYQLGYYPMVLVATALGSLATPILFEIAGSGNDFLRLQRAVRANMFHLLGLLVITLGATAGAASFGPLIFKTFTSPVYLHFASNLPLLVLSGGIFGCGQAASLVLLLENRSSRMVGIKVGTAVLGVLFNGIGAYFFGVSGAAWATLAFSLIYFIAMLSRTQLAQSGAWSARPPFPSGTRSSCPSSRSY